MAKFPVSLHTCTPNTPNMDDVFFMSVMSSADGVFVFDDNSSGGGNDNGNRNENIIGGL